MAAKQDSRHFGPSAVLQDQAAAQNALSAIPELPHEALPTVASLTRAQPSPLLRWQLLEVLYAYCCTLRTFHGDWHDAPQVDNHITQIGRRSCRLSM